MDLQLTRALRPDGRTVVTVAGDVDLASAPDLRDTAIEAIRETGPHVVLDLGGVTFMDSTGLQVLISTQRRAEMHGGSLTLTNVPTVVAKLLRVTGLDRAFPLDSPSAASGAGAPD